MDDGWTEGKGWRMNGLTGRCIQMGIWKGNSESMEEGLVERMERDGL